jgi:hypothetical protein
MRWFRPFGLVFRPVSLAGWVVTALCAAFCANVFLFVDARSHSVSDTLYGIFPYVVPTFLLWAWIAARTGGAVGRPASDAC